MKTILYGAAIAASLIGAPALAQPDANDRAPIEFTVSTKGYDLSRPGDVARLQGKVDRQIRETCTLDVMGSRIIVADARCEREMQASAARQIDRQVRVASDRAARSNGG